MIVNLFYRRRPVRRRSGPWASGFATRGRAATETGVGGWRTPPKAKEIRGIARASVAPVPKAGKPEPPADAPVEAPAAAAASAVERLAAAGYLDAGSGRALLGAQFGTIAAPLVAHAFAPDAGHRDRLILISSAGAGEGKTFTAVNLALTLSQDHGRPVLLIDADPRTAGATRAFGLNSEPGLSDALGDGLTPDLAIQPSGLDDLAFLGPGRAPATMAGLLASPRMARLTRELLARTPGGLLVIDGPALLSGSEAAALAMYAGQVVLVVAAGRTTVPAVAESLGRLGERANLWLVLARRSQDAAIASAAGRPRRGPPGN